MLEEDRLQVLTVANRHSLTAHHPPMGSRRCPKIPAKGSGTRVRLVPSFLWSRSGLGFRIRLSDCVFAARAAACCQIVGRIAFAVVSSNQHG
jgi:hypothetical protein